MADQPTARTLLDDWRFRREQLMSAPASLPAQYRDIQVQILDYLVSRYRDSTEAAQCARFPSSGAVWFNQRAIVVHNHLGSGVVSGVKTPSQARDRVASIVKRLTMTGASSEPVRIRLFGLDSRRNENRLTTAQNSAVQNVLRKLKSPESPSALRAAIAHANQLYAPLPHAAMEYLFDRVRDSSLEDFDAVNLLMRCKNSSAAGYVVLAWRERIAASGGPDSVTGHLRELFVQADVRDKVGDRVRAELASNCAAVRMEAASVLGDMAMLDDLGLLLDLLSLPEQNDEDPRERNELIAVMQKIAKMTASGRN